MKTARVAMLAFGAALFASCSSTRYHYVPSNHSADVTGESEIVYAAPFDKPSGKVKISSIGVIEVEPQKGAKRVPSVHVRVAISNQSNNLIWRFNTQDQLVSFPNDGQVAPFVVNTDIKTVPNVEIKPSELRTLDLYFALPAGAKSDRDIREFTFRWKLQAADRLAQETVLFNRITVPDLPAAVYPYAQPYPLGPGWGPVWWGHYY